MFFKSVNPPTEKIKHCIQLLNQCPSLINHPMPPYNFTPFLVSTIIKSKESGVKVQ